MIFEDLDLFTPETGAVFDVVIVGGGPAGITIAKEMSNTGFRILMIESGLNHESDAHKILNHIDCDGEPKTEDAIAFRMDFHGKNMASFDQHAQPFGIRVRALGGSAKYWGGKSATFDEMDFAKRDWVPFSGWPISLESMKPYFDRAAKWLNLGPNCYDETLWDLLGNHVKRPALDRSKLRSFFWQFARSRFKSTQIMSFHEEIHALQASNVTVLLNATVTQIGTDIKGQTFDHLEVMTLNGASTQIKAKYCVLAAGGIENARLLLCSNRTKTHGLGNEHDVVGRFLMDHPGTRIGQFSRADIDKASYLGFFTLRQRDQFTVYMHGLTFSPELQAKEQLLNAAIYTLAEISPDDPIEAIKRLVKLESKSFVADLSALVLSLGLVLKAISVKIFQSKLIPRWIQSPIVNAVMAINPNFIVREFQAKGVPHKLECLGIHVITEQQPDPESRVILSDSTDPLGVPKAKALWKISDADRRSVVRIAKLLQEEFPKAGLPAPVLADWIVHDRPTEAPLVDMAHIIGTTRMSNDCRTGVVDSDCQVFGVSNLFIAGSSVFPTSGHANPTLMITSLAIRLADHLKVKLTNG